MQKSMFFYNLPPELIAQTPIKERDCSRLLVLDKASGAISHRVFHDIKELLRPGDCLVLNDTKVLPARIFGTRRDTGAAVEFVLLADRGGDVWETLVKPGKKARVGHEFDFTNGLTGEIAGFADEGNRLIKFRYSGGNFYEILDKVGQMPLPPYITEKLLDNDRYQTVYAKEKGSAAAPTAGLHFTSELLNSLTQDGISIAYLTLHVGLGTFRPVKEDNILQHKMHSEHYTLSKAAADVINETKRRGGRVISVGTTSCRTLESVADDQGFVREQSGDTEIFIYPGYRFKCIDGLITNFHLPESTLIMLVSAFAGYESTMAAYKIAVDERYRFFSFGDAMIII